MAGPLPRQLLPDTAAVGDDGRLRIGGCDLLDLAERVRHAAVRLRRGAPAGPLPRGGRRVRRRRGLRRQGVPLPGHGPARPRGGHAPRRRHRRRAARRAGGRRARRPARAPRQQQVARRAARPRGRRASAASSSTASTSSTASPRCTREDGLRAEGAGPRHARRRGAHPRVRPHRPGRLEVRLRRARPATPRGPSPGRRTRRPSSSSASTCTSAARCSSPTSSTRRSRSWLRACARSDLPELSIGGGLGRGLRRGRGGPVDHRVGHRHRVGAAATPASTARVTAEPGRSIVAQAAVTLYTVGTIKDVPDVRTYVSVDGGMCDNPRPCSTARATRRSCPRGHRRRPAQAGDDRRQALRVGRRARARRPGARRPRGRATSSPRRSPAPTATRWAPTTTRCRARRWCSCPTAQAREVVAPRDPTTTSSATTVPL